MREIIHRLDGRITQPFIDAAEVEIEISPDTEDINGEPLVKSNTIDFDSFNGKRINAFILKNGINEGMNYSMSIKENGTELIILDSYLVLSDPSTVFSDDRITGVRTELRARNASISRQAESIYFRFLLIKGAFTTDEYVPMPYINSDVPDYKGAAIAAIMVFIVLDKLITIIKELLKVVADFGGILTALAGVLKIIVLVVWIIITIATLIIFMFSIIDQLIQPVKYMMGMGWKRQLEIGCEAMGLKFESTLFDDEFLEDTIEIPAKFQSFKDKNNESILGFIKPNTDVATGYYSGSFLDYLLETKETLKAKITLTSDNRLIMESIYQPTKQPAFRMDTKLKMKNHTTNASDIIGSYSVEFRLDSADDNTRDNYKGTITTAVTTRTKGKNTLVNGTKTVVIPYARATIKTDLTRVEKLASRLLKRYLVPINNVIIIVNLAIVLRNTAMRVINNLKSKLKVVGIRLPFKTSPVPKIPPVDETLIDNRVGMMMVSGDSTTEAKRLSINKNSNPRYTKLKDDNAEKWGSEYFYRTYHRGQSHVPSPSFPTGNQKRGFKSPMIGTCKEDLLLIVENTAIFAPNGQAGNYTSFKHKVKSATSVIEYQVPYLSDPFLREELTTPEGL